MRIQIIGGPGAGKSTLAAALSKRLSLPLLSNDDYLWADGEFLLQNPPEIRRALLERDLSRLPSFVFDGQPDATVPGVSIGADLLVFLLLPEPIRMERLRARELARFGPRILPGGDLYENSREFIGWAAEYPTGREAGTYLWHHLRMYNAFKGPKLVLSSELGADALIGHIEGLAGIR